MQQTCRTAVGPARQPQRCPLRFRVRSRRLFGRFENLVSPYPEGTPRSPPQSFVAFIWACSQGMRPILLGMTLCTAVIAMFEALLFSMLGHVVDWLTAVEPAQFWAKERGKLLLLAAIIAASPLVVALQAFLKHQALAANFPMRMRWNFHRLMLGQSMSFYQDEFAGRIAAKVMQTALAVRDTWMIIARDAGVRHHLFRDDASWCWAVSTCGCSRRFSAGSLSTCWHCRTSCRDSAASRMQQADARSLMTGRIADAYTNIATVKLFSHAKARGGLRARGHAGIHADRVRSVPARQRLRDRQPHAQHGADREHRRRCALALDEGAGRRRRRRGGHGDGAASQRHLALDHVGVRLALRAHRHGAGRHRHAGAAAHGARSPGCAAAQGAARRDPLRARQLRLRRQRRR